MKWHVRWQPAARRDLSRLDAQVQERILEAIERFAATGQGDVIRLQDVRPPEWRLRVGGWRIRFSRDDSARVLDILRVRPRDKAY
jgi:mRNA-degrading endonuclease RelE of RelBE toxin-antitoxin system